MAAITYHKALVIKQRFMNKLGLIKDEEAQFFILDYSRLDSNAKLG